jgi:hypothetical protein
MPLMETLVMVGTGDHTPPAFFLPPSPFKPSVYVLQASCRWFKTYLANHHYVCFGILQGLLLKTKGRCSASNGLAFSLTV